MTARKLEVAVIGNALLLQARDNDGSKCGLWGRKWEMLVSTPLMDAYAWGLCIPERLATTLLSEVRKDNGAL